MWYTIYMSLTNHRTKLKQECTNKFAYERVYIKLPMLILVNVNLSLLLYPDFPLEARAWVLKVFLV